MLRFMMRGMVFLSCFLIATFSLSTIVSAQTGFENILTDYQKFYAHYAPPGIHSDTESYKSVPLDKRHANCNDCHDPHAATRSLSPLGSYFGAGTQANVSGVRVFYDGVAPGAAPKYVFMSSVVKEYELCFKCHSGYSYGTLAPPAFNWTRHGYVAIVGQGAGDIVVQETDVAKELNPNNPSYHPVVAKGKRPGSERYAWAGNATFNETFVAGRSASSYIKCTDCHASDSTTVKGPHGSNNKYILKRPAPSVAEPWFQYSGPHTSGAWASWRTNNLVCYECHSVNYYGVGKGHPSGGIHGQDCFTGDTGTPLDLIGCSTCKVDPIHGDYYARWLMKTENYCYAICHGSIGSCPRFYGYDERGSKREEARVGFQAAYRADPNEYSVPLPTPDMPNLKGLATEPSYRYYNREDDYILFKEGKPMVTEDGRYQVLFDQPSIGDKPDGEPVGEVGYEDTLGLWTIDHAPNTQPYLMVDGGVVCVDEKKLVKPIRATDNNGNNVLDIITTKSASEADRQGWFAGVVGYGNTIDEIYSKGNYFILDFGDLSKSANIKLLWKVNEYKGAKLPILIQTKDENGKWVTRGSARHAEDRYGAMDIRDFFPKGTKRFLIKVIPTLNFVDWMNIATEEEPAKVTKLNLNQALYTEVTADRNIETDVTAVLAARDGNYQKFDYLDRVRLLYDIPQADKQLTKRDFVFTPVGYFVTGGPASPFYQPEAMTAEKAQDFATLTPSGGFANKYNVKLTDPDEWNAKYGLE